MQLVQQPTDEQIDEVLSEGLMKISEAAKLMSLGRTKISEMCNDGELPFVRIGKGRRIPRRSVMNYLKANLIWHAAVDVA